MTAGPMQGCASADYFEPPVCIERRIKNDLPRLAAPGLVPSIPQQKNKLSIAMLAAFVRGKDGGPRAARLAPAVGPRRCVSLPPGLLPLKSSYCVFGCGRQSHCEVEAFEGQQSGNRQLPPISTVLLADLILSVCGRFAKKPT